MTPPAASCTACKTASAVAERDEDTSPAPGRAERRTRRPLRVQSLVWARRAATRPQVLAPLPGGPATARWGQGSAEAPAAALRSFTSRPSRMLRRASLAVSHPTRPRSSVSRYRGAGPKASGTGLASAASTNRAWPGLHRKYRRPSATPSLALLLRRVSSARPTMVSPGGANGAGPTNMTVACRLPRSDTRSPGTSRSSSALPRWRAAACSSPILLASSLSRFAMSSTRPRSMAPFPARSNRSFDEPPPFALPSSWLLRLCGPPLPAAASCEALCFLGIRKFWGPQCADCFPLFGLESFRCRISSNAASWVEVSEEDEVDCRSLLELGPVSCLLCCPAPC
mmetsp:Transcript_14501/g.34411  ORF Transcript_14501/g.34411 Transcript_14501/m.34411 type:complete len:340 (-) Transcript_14501:325-1344(-)